MVKGSRSVLKSLLNTRPISKLNYSNVWYNCYSNAS